jgi:hypothetical protein
MRVAAEAADFEVAVASVQSVTEGRGRLRRTFVSEHALIPSKPGELIGFLASLPGALRRCTDRCAINALSLSLDLVPIRQECASVAAIGKPLRLTSELHRTAAHRGC